MFRSFMLIGFLVLFYSCTTEKGDTTLFENQQSLGEVNKILSEASGLVASVTNPGYLWTQNDGGNPAEIYLINEKAEVVMTCKLKNTDNRDWEDITIGPGPEPGVSYLYIADIGDNDAVFPNKILYRIKEPTFATDAEVDITEIEKLVFTLPDGERDAESILFDPLTNTFYIISKRERWLRLYEIKFPDEGETLEASIAGRLRLGRIVAANISPDGKEILLKDYENIYYWKRNDQEPLAELLQNVKPIRINYTPELQGEAIAWKRDGSGFYTLSESGMFNAAPLYFYKRRQPNTTPGE